MTDSSSEQHDNEKSEDSFSSHSNEAKGQHSNKDYFTGNEAKSSSLSKSDERCLSSCQNDDKTQHYGRLLRQSQQSVSNRDVLIGMLQSQLKKMEELYKKTLDQQQDIRLKYLNVVQELAHLKIICNKLKQENEKITHENEQNTARYLQEREALQIEVDKWKTEYDKLIIAIEKMEKNTCAMKNILSDQGKAKGQQDPGNMDRLVEQYAEIQNSLAQQNEKLDTILQRFQTAGDGDTVIVESLEKIRYANIELRNSLNSVVSERKSSIKSETGTADETVQACICDDLDEEESKQSEEEAKQSEEEAKRSEEVSKQSEEEKSTQQLMMRQAYVEETTPSSETEPSNPDCERCCDEEEEEPSLRREDSAQTDQVDLSCEGHCDEDEQEDKIVVPAAQTSFLCPTCIEEVIISPKSSDTHSCCKKRKKPKGDHRHKHKKRASSAPNEKKSQQMKNISKCCELVLCPLHSSKYKPPPCKIQYGDKTCVPKSETCVSESEACVLESETCVPKPETRDVEIMTDCECPELAEDSDVLEENRKLREELEEKEREIAKLREAKVICVKYRSDESVPSDDLHRENEELKKEVADLEEEVKGLHRKMETINEELEQSRAGRINSIDETDQLFKEYEMSMEEVNAKYTSAAGELENLRGEKRDLVQRLALMSETVKQHKEQACVCKMELKRMAARNRDFEDALTEVEDLRQKEAVNSEELRNSKATLLQLEEKYDALKQEYDRLLEDNKEVQLLKKKNANLVHELNDRDVIICDLREQITNLEEELNGVREEMVQNSTNASREMDVLMCACVDLENKLEATKAIIERESKLLDQEVNTSDTYSENDRLANANDSLRQELEERTEELQRLLRELEEVRTTYEEEIRNLKSRNDLLQLQLQREQLDHQQTVDTYEERLSAGQMRVRTRREVSEGTFGYYQGEEDKHDDLTAQLEETVERNRILTEELATSKQELECLKCVGKEHGALKAENMKLKSQISFFEKQIHATKDVEESLRKTTQLNEELNVKVQYLEKQLAASRARPTPEKISARQTSHLGSIKEEEATSKVALSPTTRPPCVCDEKKYKISTNLTVLYDNRKFSKASNTESASTVAMSEHSASYCSNRFARVQMHIASMNQMENKVAQMILAVRQQNQRASECNASRIRNEKDMESRLHMLKHKRERLMLTLDSFRKELQGLERLRSCHSHCSQHKKSDHSKFQQK